MKTKLSGNVVKKLIVPVVILVMVSQIGYAEAARVKPAGKATNKEPLVITLTSEKVVIGKDGKEVFSPADKVKPGDLLQYRAVYRNRGKSKLTGIKASLPVPTGMEYIRQTAHPEPVMATADGSKYESEPLMHTVKDKDGKEVTKEVSYAEYQGLRWQVSQLEPNKKFEVRARMRVSQPPISAAELVNKPTAVSVNQTSH